MIRTFSTNSTEQANVVNLDSLDNKGYCKNMITGGTCRFGNKCFYNKFHIPCLMIYELSLNVQQLENINEKYAELSVENSRLSDMNDMLNLNLTHTLENLQKEKDKNRELEEKYKELETIKSHLDQLVCEIMSNNELK